MKKLTVLAISLALFACLLTACRSRGDTAMTTTDSPHTLPETTGATITLPTEETTRQTQPTVPSTDRNDPTGATNGTDGTDGTQSNPRSRDRGITKTPGRY